LIGDRRCGDLGFGVVQAFRDVQGRGEVVVLFELHGSLPLPLAPRR
jgi:hypothetical protein